MIDYISREHMISQISRDKIGDEISSWDKIKQRFNLVLIKNSLTIISTNIL